MTTTPRASAARIPWPARDFPRKARMLHLNQLWLHPRNIRKTYTDLDELAASISSEGVLEPLLAHERWETLPGEVYRVELLAGHRRLMAAEIAGLERVPVTVRPRIDDDEAMFLFLGEDQKSPLTNDERRTAIVALHHEFSYDLREIAERLGIGLATVRALYDGYDVAPQRTISHPPTAAGARPRAASARRAKPTIRPTAVHELVARWDGGRISGAEVITELRTMLGDWTPTATTKQHTESTPAPEHGRSSVDDKGQNPTRRCSVTRGSETGRST